MTEAAASVGVSTTTIAKWAARGRVADADAEHRVFAETFDAIRPDRADARPIDDGQPVTSDDALGLLEQSARNGSVSAQKAVLAELRRRDEAAEMAAMLPGIFDR